MAPQQIIFIFVLSIITTICRPVAANSASIDQRIGVNHIGGAYPDRTLQNDYLNWGALRSLNMGFSNISIMMMSNLCYIRPHHPEGLYQTNDFCHPILKRPIHNNLTSLAKDRSFKNLFDKPFNKFFIFTESLDPMAAHQEDIGENIMLKDSDLSRTYIDYYDLTTHLLQTYKNTGKSFVLISPSELDHRLKKRLGCTPIVPGSKVSCFNLEPSGIPVYNAKKYLQTISRAVHQAIKDNPVKKVSVFHACEINSVARTSLKGIKSAIDLVIPYSDCDLIAYSAFESFLESSPSEDDLMTKSLNYIAKKTPDHQIFGDKNIFLSQFGFRENVEPPERFSQFTSALKQALDWGVPNVQIWTLHDDNCQDSFPATNDQCVGFWMRKPDNSPSQLYKFLRTKYSTNNNIGNSPYGGVVAGQTTEYSGQVEPNTRLYILGLCFAIAITIVGILWYRQKYAV